MASSQAGCLSTIGTAPAVLVVSVMRHASQVRGSRTIALAQMRYGDESRSAPLVPELLCGNPRALGHRGHLGPDHVGIDRGLADPGAVAAVAAGNDVFAADQFGVAPDPLRDQFR